MCLKRSKYLCFHEVSLLQLVHELAVKREDLGPHFEGFGDTWGSISVVFEGLGNRLEF